MQCVISVRQAAWRWCRGTANFEWCDDACRPGAFEPRDLAGPGSAVLPRLRLWQRRLWCRLLDGVHARLRRGVNVRHQSGVSAPSDLPASVLCAPALQPTVVTMLAMLLASVQVRGLVWHVMAVRCAVGLPCVAGRRRGHVLLLRRCPLARALRGACTVCHSCTWARWSGASFNAEIVAGTSVEYRGRELTFGSHACASAGRRG
jgi:hypothetical protein